MKMKSKLIVLLFISQSICAQTLLGTAFLDYRANNSLDNEGNTIALQRDNENFFDSIEVFDYINNQWVQRQDNIGFEASIFQLSGDGTHIILGRPSFSNAEVAVYFWDGVSWTLKGNMFTNPNTTGGLSGYKVLISDDGNRIFIRNELNDISVYDWNDSSWDLADTLIDIGGNADIAINGMGNRLAYTINNPTTGSLADYDIRILEFQNNNFQQLGNDISNPLIELGGAGPALDFNQNGSHLLISSSSSIEFNTNAGAFVVYEFVSDIWSQKGNIITGQEAFIFFGSDSAINDAGDRVVVGIVSSNAFGLSSGETKIYDLASNTWQEIASIPGALAGNQNGSDVDINANGNIISTGGNGTLPQVRVFEIEFLNVDDFNQLDTEIYPNPTSDFLFIKLESEAKLNILDLNGRLIKKNRLLIAGVNKISIETLESGLYFIEIFDGEKAYLKKVFVN
jgi:hypothetical protein